MKTKQLIRLIVLNLMVFNILMPTLSAFASTGKLASLNISLRQSVKPIKANKVFRPSLKVANPLHAFAVKDKFIGVAPLIVNFDGSKSKDRLKRTEGLEYSWDFGDGSTGQGETTTHVYTNPGTYKVEFNLCLAGTNECQRKKLGSVKVKDPLKAKAPIVVASLDNALGTAPMTVNFDADGSRDPDGSDSRINYRWEFGDGFAESGFKNLKQVSHSYTQVGEYNPKLILTDEDGLSSTKILEAVTIFEANDPGVQIEDLALTNFLEYVPEIPTEFSFNEPGLTFSGSNTFVFDFAVKTNPNFNVFAKVIRFAASQTQNQTELSLATTASFAADASGNANSKISFVNSGLADRFCTVFYTKDPNTSLVSNTILAGRIDNLNGSTLDRAQAQKTIDIAIATGQGFCFDRTNFIQRVNHYPVLDARHMIKSSSYPLSVTFDASQTYDIDGDSLNYNWSFFGQDSAGRDFGVQDGAGSDNQVISNATLTTAGFWQAKLELNDGKGGNLTYVINPIAPLDPGPPVADFAINHRVGDCALINNGLEFKEHAQKAFYCDVEFIGAFSFDPDNDLDSHNWQITNKDTGTVIEKNQADFTERLLEPGVYEVKLTVRDLEANQNSKTEDLVIHKPEPRAQALLSSRIDDYLTNKTRVSFSAEGSYDYSDLTGDALIYEWDFGDGESATGKTISHEYADEAEHDVELTVRTIDGRSTEIGVVSVNTCEVYWEDLGICDAPECGISGDYQKQRDGCANERMTHCQAQACPLTSEFTVLNDILEAPTYVSLESESQHSSVNVENVSHRYVFKQDGEDDQEQDFDEVAFFAAAVGDYEIEHEVMDNDGNTTTTVKNIHVNPANQAPIASATQSSTGGEIVLTVDFDASDSRDPEGSNLDYKWDFGDGNEASTETVTHAYSQIGEYIPKLTVTDDRGQIAEYILDKITVEEINEAPVTDFALDLLVGDNSDFSYDARVYAIGTRIDYVDEEFYSEISLDGSLSSDINSNIASFEWFIDKVGDPPTSDPVNLSRDFVYRIVEDGIYDIRLKVTDTKGLEDTASRRIIIGKSKPIAKAEMLNKTDDLDLGTSDLDFSADGSFAQGDPDGDNLDFEWDFGDGNDSRDKEVSHHYTEPGLYTPELTVKRGDIETVTKLDSVVVDMLTSGLYASVSLDNPDLIEVEDDNTTISSQTFIGDDIQITDDHWEWQAKLVDDNNPQNLIDRSVQFNQQLASQGIDPLNAPTTFVDAGQYALVHVLDQKSFLSETLTVIPNQIPVPKISLTQNGRSVSVNASGSYDPKSFDIVSYEWDFGDGSPVVLGNTASHSYVNDGLYYAQLTVTDSRGLRSRAFSPPVIISSPIKLPNIPPYQDQGTDETNDIGSARFLNIINPQVPFAQLQDISGTHRGEVHNWETTRARARALPAQCNGKTPKPVLTSVHVSTESGAAAINEKDGAEIIYIKGNTLCPGEFLGRINGSNRHGIVIDSSTAVIFPFEDDFENPGTVQVQIGNIKNGGDKVWSSAKKNIIVRSKSRSLNIGTLKDGRSFTLPVNDKNVFGITGAGNRSHFAKFTTFSNKQGPIFYKDKADRDSRLRAYNISVSGNPDTFYKLRIFTNGNNFQEMEVEVDGRRVKRLRPASGRGYTEIVSDAFQIPSNRINELRITLKNPNNLLINKIDLVSSPSTPSFTNVRINKPNAPSDVRVSANMTIQAEPGSYVHAVLVGRKSTLSSQRGNYVVWGREARQVPVGGNLVFPFRAIKFKPGIHYVMFYVTNGTPSNVNAKTEIDSLFGKFNTAFSQGKKKVYITASKYSSLVGSLASSGHAVAFNNTADIGVNIVAPTAVQANGQELILPMTNTAPPFVSSNLMYDVKLINAQTGLETVIPTPVGAQQIRFNVNPSMVSGEAGIYDLVTEARYFYNVNALEYINDKARDSKRITVYRDLAPVAKIRVTDPSKLILEPSTNVNESAVFDGAASYDPNTSLGINDSINAYNWATEFKALEAPLTQAFAQRASPHANNASTYRVGPSLTPGIYRASLNVTDRFNNIDNAKSDSVQIVRPGQKLVMSLRVKGTDKILEPDPDTGLRELFLKARVKVIGSFADPAISSLNYKFDFGDGSIETGSIAPSQILRNRFIDLTELTDRAHEYAEGEFIPSFEATVAFANGKTERWTVSAGTVTVADLPTLTSFVPYLENRSPTNQFELLGFNAILKVKDKDVINTEITEFAWDFGDGQVFSYQGSKPNLDFFKAEHTDIQHQFTSPGVYKIKFWVKTKDSGADRIEAFIQDLVIREETPAQVNSLTINGQPEDVRVDEEDLILVAAQYDSNEDIKRIELSITTIADGVKVYEKSFMEGLSRSAFDTTINTSLAPRDDYELNMLLIDKDDNEIGFRTLGFAVFETELSEEEDPSFDTRGIDFLKKGEMLYTNDVSHEPPIVVVNRVKKLSISVNGQVKRLVKELNPDIEYDLSVNLVEGINDIFISSILNNGKEYNLKSYRVYLDTVSPVVYIDTPLTDTTYSHRDLILSGEIFEDDLAEVMYRVDRGPLLKLNFEPSEEESETWFFNQKIEVNKTLSLHKVEVYAMDRTGNEIYEHVNFQIDTSTTFAERQARIKINDQNFNNDNKRICPILNNLGTNRSSEEGDVLNAINLLAYSNGLEPSYSFENVDIGNKTVRVRKYLVREGRAFDMAFKVKLLDFDNGRQDENITVGRFLLRSPRVNQIGFPLSTGSLGPYVQDFNHIIKGPEQVIILQTKKRTETFNVQDGDFYVQVSAGENLHNNSGSRDLDYVTFSSLNRDNTAGIFEADKLGTIQNTWGRGKYLFDMRTRFIRDPNETALDFQLDKRRTCQYLEPELVVEISDDDMITPFLDNLTVRPKNDADVFVGIPNNLEVSFRVRSDTKIEQKDRFVVQVQKSRIDTDDITNFELTPVPEATIEGFSYLYNVKFTAKKAVFKKSGRIGVSVFLKRNRFTDTLLKSDPVSAVKLRVLAKPKKVVIIRVEEVSDDSKPVGEPDPRRRVSYTSRRDRKLRLFVKHLRPTLDPTNGRFTPLNEELMSLGDFTIEDDGVGINLTKSDFIIDSSYTGPFTTDGGRSHEHPEKDGFARTVFITKEPIKMLKAGKLKFKLNLRDYIKSNRKFAAELNEFLKDDTKTKFFDEFPLEIKPLPVELKDLALDIGEALFEPEQGYVVPVIASAKFSTKEEGIQDNSITGKEFANIELEEFKDGVETGGEAEIETKNPRIIIPPEDEEGNILRLDNNEDLSFSTNFTFISEGSGEDQYDFSIPLLLKVPLDENRLLLLKKRNFMSFNQSKQFALPMSILINNDGLDMSLQGDLKSELMPIEFLDEPRFEKNRKASAKLRKLGRRKVKQLALGFNYSDTVDFVTDPMSMEMVLLDSNNSPITSPHTYINRKMTNRISNVRAKGARKRSKANSVVRFRDGNALRLAPKEFTDQIPAAAAIRLKLQREKENYLPQVLGPVGLNNSNEITRLHDLPDADTHPQVFTIPIGNKRVNACSFEVNGNNVPGKTLTLTEDEVKSTKIRFVSQGRSKSKVLLIDDNKNPYVLSGTDNFTPYSANDFTSLDLGQIVVEPLFIIQAIEGFMNLRSIDLGSNSVVKFVVDKATADTEILRETAFSSANSSGPAVCTINILRDAPDATEINISKLKPAIVTKVPEGRPFEVVVTTKPNAAINGVSISIDGNLVIPETSTGAKTVDLLGAGLPNTVEASGDSRHEFRVDFRYIDSTGQPVTKQPLIFEYRIVSDEEPDISFGNPQNDITQALNNPSDIPNVIFADVPPRSGETPIANSNNLAGFYKFTSNVTIESGDQDVRDNVSFQLIDNVTGQELTLLDISQTEDGDRITYTKQADIPFQSKDDIKTYTFKAFSPDGEEYSQSQEFLIIDNPSVELDLPDSLDFGDKTQTAINVGARIKNGFARNMTIQLETPVGGDIANGVDQSYETDAVLATELEGSQRFELPNNASANTLPASILAGALGGTLPEVIALTTLASAIYFNVTAEIDPLVRQRISTRFLNNQELLFATAASTLLVYQGSAKMDAIFPDGTENSSRTVLKYTGNSSKTVRVFVTRPGKYRIERMIDNQKRQLVDIEVKADRFPTQEKHGFPDLLDPEDITEESAVGVDVELPAPAVQRALTGGPNNGSNNNDSFLSLLIISSLDSLSRVVEKIEISQKEEDEFDTSCLVRRIKHEMGTSSDLVAEARLKVWLAAARLKALTMLFPGIRLADGRNKKINVGSIYEDFNRLYPGKTESGTNLANQYCHDLARHVVRDRPGLVRVFETTNHAGVGKVYWLGEGEDRLVYKSNNSGSLREIEGYGLRKILAKHISDSPRTEIPQSRFRNFKRVIGFIEEALLAEDSNTSKDENNDFSGRTTKYTRNLGDRIGTRKRERKVIIIASNQSNDSEELAIITAFPQK